MSAFANSKEAAIKMVNSLGSDAEANKKTVENLSELIKKEGATMLSEIIRPLSSTYTMRLPDHGMLLAMLSSE